MLAGARTNVTHKMPLVGGGDRSARANVGAAHLVVLPGDRIGPETAAANSANSII
jgi:hypothetical protein